MGALAVLQGLGRVGNEVYGAKQLALDEQAKKLALLQSQLGLQELRQRMGMSQQEMGLKSNQEKRAQEEFELKRQLETQPRFLGFQKVGGRVIYGLQNPDGTITTKEAEGLTDKGIADEIENGIKQLPPEAQPAARGAVGMWLADSNYDAARRAVQGLLTQYGKSQMPGQVSVSQTTGITQIDTPNGPMVIQYPKTTTTQRMPANRVTPPGATPTPGVSGTGGTARIPGVPGRILGPSKPGQQEMNRADLATNVNENLDKLEDIVKRRPDLFGPPSVFHPTKGGLATSVKSFIGTDDPDIGTLQNIKDNLGRALTGAHGMRAASGVESAGHAVLNSFRNGPKAVQAAIDSARSSVQTFINDVQRGPQGMATKPAPAKSSAKNNATVEAIVKALSQGGSSGGSQPK